MPSSIIAVETSASLAPSRTYDPICKLQTWAVLNQRVLGMIRMVPFDRAHSYVKRGGNARWLVTGG
jgi:hypothetical protein